MRFPPKRDAMLLKVYLNYNYSTQSQLWNVTVSLQMRMESGMGGHREGKAQSSLMSYSKQCFCLLGTTLQTVFYLLHFYYFLITRKVTVFLL